MVAQLPGDQGDLATMPVDPPCRRHQLGPWHSSTTLIPRLDGTCETLSPGYRRHLQDPGASRSSTASVPGALGPSVDGRSRSLHRMGSQGPWLANFPRCQGDRLSAGRLVTRCRGNLVPRWLRDLVDEVLWSPGPARFPGDMGPKLPSWRRSDGPSTAMVAHRPRFRYDPVPSVAHRPRSRHRLDARAFAAPRCQGPQASSISIGPGQPATLVPSRQGPAGHGSTKDVQVPRSYVRLDPWAPGRPWDPRHFITLASQGPRRPAHLNIKGTARPRCQVPPSTLVPRRLDRPGSRRPARSRRDIGPGARGQGRGAVAASVESRPGPRGRTEGNPSKKLGLPH